MEITVVKASWGLHMEIPVVVKASWSKKGIPVCKKERVAS